MLKIFYSDVCYSQKLKTPPALNGICNILNILKTIWYCHESLIKDWLLIIVLLNVYLTICRREKPTDLFHENKHLTLTWLEWRGRETREVGGGASLVYLCPYFDSSVDHWPPHPH